MQTHTYTHIWSCFIVKVSDRTSIFVSDFLHRCSSNNEKSDVFEFRNKTFYFTLRHNDIVRKSIARSSIHTWRPIGFSIFYQVDISVSVCLCLCLDPFRSLVTTTNTNTTSLSGTDVHFCFPHSGSSLCSVLAIFLQIWFFTSHLQLLIRFQSGAVVSLNIKWAALIVERCLGSGPLGELYNVCLISHSHTSIYRWCSISSGEEDLKDTDGPGSCD